MPPARPHTLDEPEVAVRHHAGTTPRSTAAGPPVVGARAGMLTALQRSAGNAAVARLIAGGAGPANRGQAPVPAETAEQEPQDESVEVDQPPVVSVMTGGGEGGSTAGPDGGAQEETGPTPEQRVAAIVADAQQSEQQVETIAGAQRTGVTGRFAAVRARISAALNATSAGIRGFISARQTEVGTVSTGVVTSGRALLATTVQAARGQVDQARGVLDGLAQGATARLQAGVGGVAGRITGLVDALPLPNLPGVSILRSGARGLAARAAGVVTAGLARVRGVIGTVVGGGTRMLGSLLDSAGRAAGSLLERLATGIGQAVRAVLGGLARVGAAVVDGLRRAVNATVLPAVDRAAATLTGRVETARQHAVKAIHDNRDRHVAAVRTGSGPETVDEAKEGNATIVSTYRERTGGILGEVFGALGGLVTTVADRVGGAVTRVVDLVRAPVDGLLGRVRQAGEAVGGFLRTLLGEVGAAVSGVVGFVREAVQEPVEAVVRFASGAAARIGRFFAGLPGRILRGDLSVPGVSEVVGNDIERRPRDPIVKPPPRGPITLPGLKTIVLLFAVVGAIVAYYVPQFLVVVAAVLALLGITVTEITLLVITGIAALLLLALLLLAVYLLYKAVTRKPRPKPKPPTIVHETALPAPDGSSDNRNDVGVGEKVEFTGSTAGVWTASAGSPRRGTGPKFLWTAPDRKRASVTIRLRVGRASATEKLRVVEPGDTAGHKLSELTYPSGQAGAGMKLDFELTPLNVSFANTEIREVAGPASDVKGYYRRFKRKDLFHDPGPLRFFPINQKNRLANGVSDEAAQGPFAPPWSDGSFHWKIPNRFRVVTESGDGKKYTTVKQEFGIEASGKASVDKAGAHVDRSP